MTFTGRKNNVIGHVAVKVFVVTLFLQEKLKLVTVLGAGLLCGTALAVIIPEGVHALYEEILEGIMSFSPQHLSPFKVVLHYVETSILVIF